MTEEKRLKLDTSKTKKRGFVEVDGMVWEIVLPGSGAELELSRAQRRLKLLDRKIDDGSATEADYDKYDELESYIVTFMKSMFKDKTKDNSEVNKWVDETSVYDMYVYFKGIQDQANA